MPERGVGTGRLLLERDKELAAIERVIESATSGNGAIAIVEGHAGVGKTLLLDALIERAADRGVEILTARGVEMEEDFSFGVVLQLLQRRVLKASPSEREDLLSGAASLAAPLLEGTKVAGIEGPEAAFAMSHGLYWVVANLAERRPVALVVDDAHWADGASMRFLASLTNRLDGLAVVIVLARRLGEAGVAVDVLETISGSAAASVLTVPSLSEGAVAALVRARYDPVAEDGFCEACFRSVKGNPFYLGELLAELSVRAVPADAHGAELVQNMDSEALGRAVRSRLARAGPTATQLAEAASVSDGGMSIRLVARLAELEVKDAEELAVTLANADIVEPRDPVGFVHPLIRNVVYSGIGGSRRAAMHLRAAEILRDEGADPERIAGHLLSAEPQSNDWVADVLLAAARTAMEHAAPDTAVLHLRHALAGDVGDERRTAILSQLGLADLWTGEPDGLDIVREAIDRLGSTRDRALYLLVASEILFSARRFEEAIELARASLAEVHEEEDDATAGQVIAYIAALSAVTRLSDRESILRLPALCDRIVGRKQVAETPVERLVAGVFAGIISLTGERSADEAKALARRALASATDEEMSGPMFQAPMGQAFSDAFDEAEESYGRFIEIAQRSGIQHTFASALGARGDGRYRAGRLADAVADAEAAIETGRGTWMELQARGPLARCLLDMGDTEAAERATTLDQPEQWNGATHLALVHEARGHVLMTRGRPQAALEAFRAAGQVATSANANNPAFCAWRSGAALAEAALGNRDAALAFAREEVDLAREFGAKRAIGIALRVSGLVEGGKLGLARLREAAGLLADSGARLEWARALTDLGGALRRAGSTTEAREQLRLAMDIAAECGADGLLRRARDEMTASGGRPRRERLTGPSALTPQERRIAELVAKGLSNREIAQSLFLTRKTIETHLTNVYAKVGIHSREELAPLLRESSA